MQRDARVQEHKSVLSAGSLMCAGAGVLTTGKSGQSQQLAVVPTQASLLLAPSPCLSNSHQVRSGTARQRFSLPLTPAW